MISVSDFNFGRLHIKLLTMIIEELSQSAEQWFRGPISLLEHTLGGEPQTVYDLELGSGLPSVMLPKFYQRDRA
jgi:hypothetical protein